MIDRAQMLDDDRMEELYGLAVRNGMISESQADRINYWASAEHALAAARPADSCGHLWAWMVAGNHWDKIAEAEEDNALRRIKKVDGTAGKDRGKSSDEEVTWERQKAIHQKVLEHANQARS